MEIEDALLNNNTVSTMLHCILIGLYINLKWHSTFCVDCQPKLFSFGDDLIFEIINF